MSIRITVTCDGCGDDEEITPFVNSRIEDINVSEELNGWVTAEEDSDVHYCQYCAEEKGLVQPPLSGHPDPARALPPPTLAAFAHTPLGFSTRYTSCDYGHVVTADSVKICKECARVGIA